jgi:hypothetical protein
VAAFERQALDAYILGFRHPGSGKPIRFEKKLSNDINRLIGTLESV